MTKQPDLLTATLTLLALSFNAYAQVEQPNESTARNFFARATVCHNNKDYQCAIDYYSHSLRYLRKPQTTARLAWVCHERYRFTESASPEAANSLLCAKQYYLQTIHYCENEATTWDTKVDDCERTQRQWRILQEAADIQAQIPAARSPSYAMIPSSALPHSYVPYNHPPDHREVINSPARKMPIDHSRNLRIVGIVLGCAGLAGAAVGVGLSQAAMSDVAPYYNGPHVWNSYDTLTLGAGGVALLGGALWLSGKIMQPRVLVRPSYSYYR